MSALAVLTRPTDPGTDDRDLVVGVRAGDDRAFELLYQRYQPRIAAYVRGMVRDHGRAEDITQEVFISALGRMREEREREILFKPWIYEIAKNKCIDAFRRGRATSEVSFDAQDAIGADEHGRLAEPGATPDSAVEGKVAIDNLCGAFGGLSPVHHDILVLREFDGLSYREIGERLGMSRPAVESTLFRARKRLSEEYEELVSGERCLRVQRIVDASEGGTAGMRDQRRMARHLAHCQPCRRYARLAGIDLGDAARPAVAVAARIAAFLPLPSFLRRRWGGEDGAALLAPRGGGGAVSQLSANLASVVDPGAASSWAKAVATAATVAVAGMGAGAAFTDRQPLQQFGPGVAPLTTSAGTGAAARGTRTERVSSPAGGAARRGAERIRMSTSPRRVTLRSARPATANGPPPAIGRPAARPVSRDAGASSGTPPAATAPKAPSGAQGGQRADPVNRVLDGVRRDPVVGPAPVIVPVTPALGAVTPPVAQAGSAAGQALTSTLDATVAGQPAPTALGDTVSNTVSETLTMTTTTVNGLGGG
jgi:RNA polymerase sigma factor (sigma-70 family)